jgi:hypothetical protein
MSGWPASEWPAGSTASSGSSSSRIWARCRFGGCGAKLYSQVATACRRPSHKGAVMSSGGSGRTETRIPGWRAPKARSACGSSSRPALLNALSMISGWLAPAARNSCSTAATPASSR